MRPKITRKFDKLVEALAVARQARKAASLKSRSVVTNGGKGRRAATLASKAGTSAVEVELEALKAERRALKKLHAFAVRHAELAQDDGPTGDKRGKKKGSGSKTRKPAAELMPAKPRADD